MMMEKPGLPRRFPIWSVLLVVFVVSSWAYSPVVWSEEDRLVLFSDLHFNPFQDKKIVQELIDANYWDWYRIFSTSTLKKPSSFGSDTNYPLFASALERIKRSCTNPDLILFSGDVLAHDFNVMFQSYSLSKTKYRAFVMKTLKFVGSEISHHFPDTPIYFTLGNNDQFDGDYNIPPNGAFLHSAADIFYRFWLKGDTSGPAGFADTFVVGGNYAIASLETAKLRLISFNSVYFSSKNNYRDEGWLQLKWLQEQLAAAHENGQKAWVLTHIPPGVDVYSTLQAPGTIVTYWDESTKNDKGRTYLEEFEYLMAQYASDVKAVFSGHTHMDHFRLISDLDGGARVSAFVHVIPAISPRSGNNSAFEVLRYDHDTLTVLDYETHYHDQELREWEREYDFQDTYRKHTMTPSTLASIKGSLEKNTFLKSMFIKFYDVNNPNNVPIDDLNWNAYWCSIVELTPAAFSACYP
jgi:sphingomyelin phosphodiesterase acid-like 3